MYVSYRPYVASRLPAATGHSTLPLTRSRLGVLTRIIPTQLPSSAPLLSRLADHAQHATPASGLSATAPTWHYLVRGRSNAMHEKGPLRCLRLLPRSFTGATLLTARLRAAATKRTDDKLAVSVTVKVSSLFSLAFLYIRAGAFIYLFGFVPACVASITYWFPPPSSCLPLLQPFSMLYPSHNSCCHYCIQLLPPSHRLLTCAACLLPYLHSI